jgi:hypothetical protein
VSITLGHERVAQLALQRAETVLPEGAWGVWCLHEKCWVDPAGYGGERDAWRALLQVTTRHPWELRVAQADKEGQPLLTKDGKPDKPPCDTCGGTGDCHACAGDGQCPDCNGSGKVDET